MRACSYASSSVPTVWAVRFLFVGLVAVLAASSVQAQLAAPNDAGVSFSHVHLTVTDIELHKRLWTDLFDGVVAEKAGYVVIRVPGTLVFLRDREPTAPSHGTAMDHFALRVHDLGAILHQWRSLGYGVDEESSAAESLARAYITLPDGIRLELVEAPGLSVKAEMDHVHFYTPQYRELMAWYVDLFGAIAQDSSTTEMTASVPGSDLRFRHVDEERMPTDSTAIDHVGFEIDDMDAFAEMLRGKGIEFVFGPVHIESLDIEIAFFLDPSGVLVEISEGLDTY